MSETESNRRPPPRVKLPLWAALLVFTLVSLLLGSTGWWLFQTVRSTVSEIEITEPELAAGDGGADSADTDTGSSLFNPQVTISDGEQPVGLEPEATAEPFFDLSGFTPWGGNERVNVLLLGIDTRCEDEGPTRTDSMMVISIDPRSKTASVLSLPRDTWVQIPGFGNDRINKAHYLGEINEYPGGGPALAMETVQSFLGIEVNHFVAINFEAFRDFINLIDGIMIDVPTVIDDPTYPDECYGYDPFRVEPGLQPMDGPIALKYARTRATEGGDIDRANRQQQVIIGVQQKLLDVNMIPKLIVRSPQLWGSFQRNIKTSFTELEAIQLALLVQDIRPEDIRSGVIDYNYVENAVTPDSQFVLIPDYNKISGLRDDLFAAVEPPPPAIENLPELVAEEGARIAVWNGTQTFGLAGETETFLIDNGIVVTEIGNADSSVVPTTQIIDYGTHTYTTLYLTQLMDLPPLNVSSGIEPDGDFDVLIVLGFGWEIPAE